MAGKAEREKGVMGRVGVWFRIPVPILVGLMEAGGIS